jgi:hypothetical protein
MSAIGKKRNRRVVPGRVRLEKLSKARLIELIIEEREAARLRLEEKDKRIAELSEQLATIQHEHDEQSTTNRSTSRAPRSRNGTRTATRNHPRTAERESGKKGPVVAMAGNPILYRMRPTTFPWMPARVAGLTCVTGKARSAPGVG